MTKREKYFKDDITPNEAYDLLFEFVGYISLLKVDSQDERIKTYDKVMEFLNQPLKPTLTEDEKVILRNAHSPNGTIAYYVGRDKDTKNLFMRTKYDLYQYDWGCFDTLFQFIKPRRRI